MTASGDGGRCGLECGTSGAGRRRIQRCEEGDGGWSAMEMECGVSGAGGWSAARRELSDERDGIWAKTASGAGRRGAMGDGQRLRWEMECDGDGVRRVGSWGMECGTSGAERRARWEMGKDCDGRWSAMEMECGASGAGRRGAMGDGSCAAVQTARSDFPHANRDPLLPRFFETTEHPNNPGRTTWVGSVDPVVFVENSKAYGKMGYPTSIDPKVLFKDGYIEVPPGITVMVENVRSPRDRKLDIVKLVVQGGDENRRLYPDIVAEMENVRDDVLGPKDLRNANSDDGTDFERTDGRAIKNGQGGRSYSTSLTTELQKKLTHPAANVRTEEGQEGTLDVGQTRMKWMTSVAIMLSSKVLEQRLYPDWLRVHNEHADVVNLPPVGGDINRGYFTHTQINIAAPAKYNANSTLSSDLKTAGSAHDDGADDPFSLSAMTSIGDLGDLHPGHFHFPELGLYVRLDYMTTVLFSGRHIHGSTPPQPLDPNFNITLDLIRLTVICYLKLLASNRSMDGSLAVCPSLLPQGSSFEVNLAPHFHDDHELAVRGPYLSFAREGEAVMPFVLLVTFIIREILATVVSLLRCMERSVPMRVDTSAFLRAFSYQDREGEWHPVPSWDNAPGVSQVTDAFRKQVTDEYQEWIKRCSVVIPKVVNSDSCKTYRIDPPKIEELPDEVPVDLSDEIPDSEDEATSLPDVEHSRSAHNGHSNSSTPVPPRQTRRAHRVIHDDQDVEESESEGEEDEDHDELGMRYQEGFGGVPPKTITLSEDDLEPIPSVLNKWPVFDLAARRDATPKSSKRGVRFASSLRSITIPTIPPNLDMQPSVAHIVRGSRQSLLSLSRVVTSEGSLDLLLDLRTSFQALETACTASENTRAVLSLCQSSIMLGHWQMWRHLQFVVAQEVSECFRHQDNQLACNCWVKSLVTFVWGLVVGPKRKADVSFGDVFPRSTRRSRQDGPSFYSAIVSMKSTRDAGDTRGRVLDLSLTILAKWLGLQPPDVGKNAHLVNLWDIRGGLVQVLVSMRRPGLFLLDEVFKLFDSPVPYVFSKAAHVNGNVLPSIIQERLLFTEERSTAMDKLAKALQTHAPDAYRCAMAAFPFPAALMPDVPVLPGRTLFLRTAADYLRRSRKLRNPRVAAKSKDPLITWMGKKNDQRNPNREGAPSRRVFKSDDTITEEFVRSKGGFFSVTSFRAITYSSNYLLEGNGRVRFDDLKSWKAATGGVQANDLCNKNAYGPAMGGRSPKYASEYWRKSSTWVTFLKDHPNPTFQETLDHINKQDLSQVGPLTAMLMAEDLVYAGVVQFPSDEEFANIALGMKKGASWALDAFNALPDYQGYVTAANAEAFVTLYHDLKALLLSTGDEDLLPDIFSF
ncbi:hypothetical protein SCHPADRAFT_946875 [Schizopora paradoxa]|uniref:Uncharacterized protein n=1 Tax=Schizopora paradoxa TaxID=27342 RepID=A0A0H2R132_9AGAM|nr:hypothetical protein SCHPADRAFT_946875 [Schizopora paradoxa]